MNLDNLTKMVTNGINDSWPTIYKIRYIYLNLGKYLSKDTDFFFSCDNKLDELNMSYEELKETYESLEGKNYKVICRSASEILKYIYEKVGIKSKLIKQINKPIKVTMDDKDINMYHYFLAVYDENKIYFMTLASDLPYIKEGMKTKLFANNIPYQRLLPDGSVEQIYEGEEINNSILLPEELKKIDEEIGYIKNYYNYDDEGHHKNDFYLQYNDAAFLMLKEEFKNNKLYNKIEAEKTHFYRFLYKFVGTNKVVSFSDNLFSEISSENFNIWIRNLCYLVTGKLSEITNTYINYDFNNNFNYNDWIYNIVKTIQNHILVQANHNEYNDIFNDLYVKEDFNYSKWSKEIKKEFGSYNLYDYNNMLSILDKTNALVNYIDNQNGNFNDLLNKLAYHFIKREYIITDKDQKEFIPNTYIAHKFRTLFNMIFECNKRINDFNTRDYSEQIVLIKEIIEIMFQELNQNNSNIEGYDSRYSSVQNRIHIYPIKSLDDETYSIVFNIVGDNTSGDYYFLYNPKSNSFDSADILDIYNNYVVVSERFKNRLEEIEDIDMNLKR